MAKFVKKTSNILKVLSSLFLCMVPWVKMSTSRDRLLDLNLLSLLYSLILIFVVHYIFLIVTYLLCKVTKTPLPATKALTLTCSMKTLPIAMTIISFLPESMGSQGIVLVPAILFHFFQLLNCSFITVKWTPKVVKEPESKKEMEISVEEPHVIPKTTEIENDCLSVC